MNKCRIVFLVGFILYLCVFGCHHSNNPGHKVFKYKNPIYSKDLAAIRDAQIIEENGIYYLIGTCPPFWKGPNPGVKVYSSKNLLDWKFETFLIKRDTLNHDVWYLDRFWAPELHAIHGKYYLTFNCRNETTGFPHSCGIAVADDILGPYRIISHNKPLIENGNDLTIFSDDDGRSYVYWSGIWGQEIDLETFRLAGEPVQCINKEEGKWDGIGIEGPFVIKRNGIYYMFYSSWTRGYEIGYATAKHPLGPWEKFVGNPIFGGQNPETCKKRNIEYTGDPDSPYKGVGHNAIFKGPDGRDWIVCHYQEREKEPTLGFDSIWFENGVIKTNGPTYTEQVVTY